MDKLNVCKKCGMENTIWPKWIGKKRIYVCECGEIAKIPKGVKTYTLEVMKE
jgi:hypothetical protein